MLEASVQKNNLRYTILVITLLAGILSSCKSSSKGFSLFSISDEEKELIADAEYIEAIKEKNRGNYDKSVALFQEVIKDSKYPSAAHFELAKIYEATKNYEAALVEINKAVELNNSNKWYLDFQIELTRSLGLFNQTTTAFKLRKKVFPENTENDVEFSDFYIQTKQYEKAIELYEEIEKRIGVSEEINKNKYIIYFRMGQDDKALYELQKLMVAFPHQTKYHVLVANIYMQQNQKDKALKIYEEALRVNPDDPFILVEVANHKYIKGDSTTAYPLYEQVLKNTEYPIKNKLDLLRKFGRMGSMNEDVYRRTRQLMKTAGQSAPFDASIQTIVAEFFYRDQKYDIARNHFQSVLNIKPNSFRIWRQILMCNYHLQDFDGMVKNANTSIDLFPTQPELYLYCGIGYNQLKQYQKGINKLEEGIELVIDNDELTDEFRSNLADAYHLMGNHKKSDEFFELSLKTNPRNAYMLNNYAYYLSERNHNLEKAMEMSAKSNILQPNESSFEDTYGWILFQMKKYEDALEWMKKSIEHGGENSGTINEHLGDIYFHLNQKDQALKFWKIAKDLEGTSDQLPEKIKQKKFIP